MVHPKINNLLEETHVAQNTLKLATLQLVYESMLQLEH